MPRDMNVRARVVDYLIANGPVVDSSGRATSRLREAVGYAGGDAGFIRIVSLLEESGDVRRDIRGKRTYRITVTDQARQGAAGRPPAPLPRLATVPPSPPGEGGNDLDYDELASVLLARVAHVLSAAESSDGGEEAPWARRRMQHLERRMTELERDLARAKAEAQAAAAERDALQSQLDISLKNNDELIERMGSAAKRAAPRAADRLDQDEQALLYRLQHRRAPTGSGD